MFNGSTSPFALRRRRDPSVSRVWSVVCACSAACGCTPLVHSLINHFRQEYTTDMPQDMPLDPVPTTLSRVALQCSRAQLLEMLQGACVRRSRLEAWRS